MKNYSFDTNSATTGTAASANVSVGWKSQAVGEKFFVDTPFTKAKGAEKGDLELNGYASTWMKDRDEEYVHPQAFDESLDAYLKDNPILLWQHNPLMPIGTVRGGQVDEHGLVTRSLMKKPEDREPDWKHLAYHSVDAGIVRTHSIGGFFEREMVGSRIYIMKVHLMELSVVSIPSNPASIFEAAMKSVKGISLRPEITQAHINQMKQVLGMAEITDPELVLMSPDQRYARYKELAAHYKACGRIAPDYEAFHELAKEALSSKGLAAVGAGKRVIDLTRRVQGFAPADEKAGRTISAKTEDTLRQAIEHMSEAAKIIQAVIEPQDEDTPEETT